MKNEKFFHTVAKINQVSIEMELELLSDEFIDPKDRHITWLRFMGLIETWHIKDQTNETK